jgi:hypothetical protein
MPFLIADPQQIPSGPLNPCEIFMSLYENSTADAITPRTPLTSSQPVSLRPNRQPYLAPSPDSFPKKSLSLTTSSPCADQIEYNRLCVSNPLASLLFFTLLFVRRSVINSIFAIAFVLAGCTHIPTWSNSSYGLNPVSRRRFSI